MYVSLSKWTFRCLYRTKGLQRYNDSSLMPRFTLIYPSHLTLVSQRVASMNSEFLPRSPLSRWWWMVRLKFSKPPAKSMVIRYRTGWARVGLQDQGRCCIFCCWAPTAVLESISRWHLWYRHSRADCSAPPSYLGEVGVICNRMPSIALCLCSPVCAVAVRCCLTSFVHNFGVICLLLLKKFIYHFEATCLLLNWACS